MITKCRSCGSKNLGQALKLKGLMLLFCKECTLLQRQDDISYEANFNFEERQFELDYYPAFLSKNELDCVTESVMFFSLKAIERLLNDNGFKLMDADIEGNKLLVSFDKLSKLEKLQSLEKKLRLDNQFSFFLWAVKLK
jgi:hypothetical protein